MKIKITSIQNSADAVKNLKHSIQTRDIAAAMNQFIVVERCLSTIRVQNGLRGIGSIESDFAKIRLNDLYPLGRKKIYYLFDFGDHWTFEIRKARAVKKPEADVKYPRVVGAIGPAPEQYPVWDDS